MQSKLTDCLLVRMGGSSSVHLIIPALLVRLNMQLVSCCFPIRITTNDSEDILISWHCYFLLYDWPMNVVAVDALPGDSVLLAIAVRLNSC